ncbi:MAG TPA: hypothetical protein VK638_57240 [Edaphobacter sp.]|nr:hypothetical protein [Edaphobacter sp.]
MNKLLITALLLAASVSPVWAVTCLNNSGDVALVQSALNDGGTVTIVGTCLFNSPPSIPSNTIVQGSGSNGNTSGQGATSNTVIKAATSPNYAFTTTGHNVAINGLTLNGGGLGFLGNYTGTTTNTGAYTVTNNTIQHIWKGGDNGTGIMAPHVWTYDGVTRNLIANNILSDIWGPTAAGWPNYPSGFTAANCGSECVQGAGINIHGAMTETTITNNLFEKIGDDGIIYKYGDISSVAHPEYYFLPNHNEISYNVFNLLHRYAIETQGSDDFNTGCLGGQCQVVLEGTNETVKGNFWHNPQDEANTIAFSLVQFTTHSTIINNTASMDVTTCVTRPGIGFEDSQLGSGANSSLHQGNVVSSVGTDCGASRFGFQTLVTQTYSNGQIPPPSLTNFTNDSFCGPGALSDITTDIPNENQDATGGSYSGTNTNTLTGMRWSTSCTGTVGSSNISLSFTSANNQSFPSGGSGIWSLQAKNPISLKWVKFYLDGSTTPVVMQEIQDVSTTFQTDEQWLYHATINTSTLAAGSHTIVAKATDVANSTVTSSPQTFSVGSVPGIFPR